MRKNKRVEEVKIFSKFPTVVLQHRLLHDRPFSLRLHLSLLWLLHPPHGADREVFPDHLRHPEHRHDHSQELPDRPLSYWLYWDLLGCYDIARSVSRLGILSRKLPHILPKITQDSDLNISAKDFSERVLIN